jgi:hypothetical protein
MGTLGNLVLLFNGTRSGVINQAGLGRWKVGGRGIGKSACYANRRA